MQNVSPAQLLASLPAKFREEHLASLSLEAKAALAYQWEFWARPDQLPPKVGNNGLPWVTWMPLAGRGWGKTRTGSEWVRSMACGSTPLAAGKLTRFALIAETAADARDVMVEGESGLLSVHPKDFRPHYEPSKRRLTWPNGVVATLYNGTEPDQLRGPQHDGAWVDELAKYGSAQETWDMLQFGLRLGMAPQQIVTTTPRPIPLIRKLIKDPTTAVTRGRTRDNASNLAPSFLQTVVGKYEGTRLGRQELDAEILDDLVGAFWDRAEIDRLRVTRPPDMQRVVVAVDPSGTKGVSDEGDEIGIVVVGKGVDGRGYVLADRTCKLGPDGWGRMAVRAYHEFKADRIVAERNFGGAMVEHVIKTVDPNASYKEVTASRGKVARAEPIAALYEQGKVSHVGTLNDLEDQMCLFSGEGYFGEGSPDRADALVWGLTEVVLNGSTFTLEHV